MTAQMQTVSEFYGDGSDLPEIHPNREINYSILVGELCAKLDTCRKVMAQVVNEVDLVTPNGLRVKDNVRWALNESHPKTLHENHPNCG